MRLLVGDYIAEGHLVFERKRLADFAASVVDGRLFRQAARLSSCGLQAALILEGTCAGAAGLGIRREALVGALVTVSLVYGIPVLRSAGPEETARLIVYAARQTCRVGQGPLPRPGWRPRGRRRRQLYVLLGLPDVGPARAEALLNAFGSLRAVFNATPKELRDVRGIGKLTVRRIIRLVE